MKQECTYLATLAKRSPLFDGIGIDPLSALFSCLGARRVRLAKGEPLMHTGKKADHFGIVLSGSLAVSTYDTDGKRTLIKLISAPESVAAAQALSGADTMSVDVAASEESEVLLLKAARIVTPCECACAFHARLVRNIMRTLAVKTLELNRKIEILSHRSTQDRLMAYLRAVAQQKCTVEFDIPFDRQQLADYLSVERSALSAEISRLSKLGLITSRKNHFTIRRSI
ncbi:MAG: Crp/Fnr family transcriptional regulator [Kiritimatiellae bacterium]|nr:Crp/Fnr family transcriptional regulator [Kiritimatiellia bacterium]